MDQPIELTAQLRAASKKTRGRGFGWDIRTTSPTRIVFRGDRKEIARDLAVLMAERIRTALQSGRTVEGKPLPAADRSTLERRRYRAEQAGRGGKWAQRYKTPAKGGAGARFRRRVDSKFTPRLPVSPHRGFDTGLLAGSLKIKAQGVRWLLTVHPKRASNAILTRVFGPGGIAAWSPGAMRTPEMQEGLRELLRRQLSADSRAAWRRIGSELKRTLKNVASLFEAAEDVAEE